MLKLKVCALIYFQFLCYFIVQSKNYCSSNNCKTNKQLCKFQQSQNPARHCINFEKLIKSDNDKKSILDKINSRRNKVAAGETKSYPPSENMMKLEWNTKLELSAQRWANQCVKSSTPDIKDACRDLDNMQVGQNIASIYGESPGLIVTALVDVWYMELLSVNGSILPAFKSSVEGGTHHDYFTQLVWANTTEVGCGSVKFREHLHDQEEGKNRTVYRLVCNFAPSGNIEGQPVYTSGPPCSMCPNGTTCDAVYRALCSKPESYYTRDITTITRTEVPIISSTNRDNVTKVDDLKDAQEDIKNKTADESDEENFTPYDFFGHLHDFTTQSITLMTPVKQVCRDNVAVDAFIETLRKKLSSDHSFKEMFFTMSTPGVPEITFTDPSVAAFVNKIYSKKELSTTTKSTQSELLNSTLLVDLVEAVIFRSGASGSIPRENLEFSTPIVSDVSPIKVQAELAQIQQNEDFTGHYFFPEDEDDSSTAEGVESTEYNYDDPNLSISDVIMEIEDIQKTAITKNFLDEILELEPTIETTTKTLVLRPDDLNAHKPGHEVMKKFLEDIRFREKSENR